MSDVGFYHEGSRKLQDQFDTRRLADRLEEHLVRDVIQPSQKQFIEGLDMFFLATAGPDGQPDCSFKGGRPGFVPCASELVLELREPPHVFPVDALRDVFERADRLVACFALGHARWFGIPSGDRKGRDKSARDCRQHAQGRRGRPEIR